MPEAAGMVASTSTGGKGLFSLADHYLQETMAANESHFARCCRRTSPDPACILGIPTAFTDVRKSPRILLYLGRLQIRRSLRSVLFHEISNLAEPVTVHSSTSASKAAVP
jgi:hypothetical protein